MGSNVILSVIIPTHNRSRYAIKTIESLLTLSDSIEIVVADTSDVDELSKLLVALPQSGQVKHLRPGVGISMVDNFNAGLQAATGDYLIFIGDDDFITKDVLQVAQWAKNKQVDVVKFTFSTLYYWPDFRHTRRDDAFAGTLRISSFSGQVRQHDEKQAMFEALDAFGDGPVNMPRAYLGMISKQLVDRIVKKYGALFGGVSPDVYSACLISLEATLCYLVDFPVIIPGASSMSGSGQAAEGKHVGKLRGNIHLSAYRNLQWDRRIPEFYSVPTTWSYSLLKAVDKLGLDETKVNYARLFVKCLFYHQQYRKEILASLHYHFQRTAGKRILWQLPVALLSELGWLAGKAFARLRGVFVQETPAVILDALQDVGQARLALENHLDHNLRNLAERLHEVEK